MSNLTALPRPNPDVVWTPLPDGAVLFATESEFYYGLNTVGALIWTLLPTSQTIDELCDAVEQTYPDVAQAQIRQDVVELLEDLMKFSLVLVPEGE